MWLPFCGLWRIICHPKSNYIRASGSQPQLTTRSSKGQCIASLGQQENCKLCWLRYMVLMKRLNFFLGGWRTELLHILELWFQTSHLLCPSAFLLTRSQSFTPRKGTQSLLSDGPSPKEPFSRSPNSQGCICVFEEYNESINNKNSNNDYHSGSKGNT